MMRNYATHYPYPVIIELMQEAIKDLVGTHDFTGFTASGTSVENKVRTIFDAKIQFEASKNLFNFYLYRKWFFV